MKNYIHLGVISLFLSLLSCNTTNTTKQDVAMLEATYSETKLEDSPALVTVANNDFADFVYDIGPRFTAITKRDLDTLRSFSDIIGDEHANRIVRYKSVNVIVLKNDRKSDLRVDGIANAFSPAQLSFIKSLDYGTDVLLTADYVEQFEGYEHQEHNSWTPYLTIVPQTQATYIDGFDALRTHLKESTAKMRATLDSKKLNGAKLYFTVTKNGVIENAYLDRTSGYETVDAAMIDLITKTTAKWIPAKNAAGENVEQLLVVSFGAKGC